MKSKFFVEKEEHGITILKWLKLKFEFIPQSMFFKIIRNRDILLNDKKPKTDDILRTGDCISIYDGDLKKFQKITDEVESQNNNSAYSPYFIKKAPQIWQNISIIHEDENIIVIDKPSNISTQGGTDVLISLVDLVSYMIEKKVFITHRLDKNTTGIIIFAKNSLAASLIGKAFRERKVQKKYQAIVHGHIASSQWIVTSFSKITDKYGEYIKSEYFMNRMLKNIMNRMQNYSLQEQKEILYEFLSQEEEFPSLGITYLSVDEQIWHNNKAYSMISLYPITGRKHQLRSQMLLYGHSIVGDPNYTHSSICKICYENKSNINCFGTNRMMLHCSEMSFDELSFTKSSKFTSHKDLLQ